MWGLTPGFNSRSTCTASPAISEKMSCRGLMETKTRGCVSATTCCMAPDRRMRERRHLLMRVRTVDSRALNWDKAVVGRMICYSITFLQQEIVVCPGLKAAEKIGRAHV